MTLAQTSNATRRLMDLGQSVWLDYLSRGLITSGELDRMVRESWISGMTSNPTIFEKSISGSDDYDDQLRELAGRGRLTPYDAFVEIAVRDIRAACDALRPVYDATGGVDGYVSLENPPGTETSVEASVEEAVRLNTLVDRPNVMIKL